MSRAILLLSGGIDSTTLLHKLEAEERDVTALVFNYGQSLIKEVEVANANAKRCGAGCITLETPLGWLDSGCTLLNPEMEIESGRSRAEIAKGGTPSSYVPFRNGIFLAYAIAYGEAQGIEEIYFGGNGLDSGNYWDDTMEFARAMQEAGFQGTDPKYQPKILAPFAKITKREVVKIGTALGVDYAQTWSCYNNGDTHCGACDSCVQRQEALSE